MITPGFRLLLGRLQAFKVSAFGQDSEDSMVDRCERNETPVESLNDANIISSLLKRGRRSNDRRHLIAIDVDHPTYLIPSSTPNHFHLYVDIPGGVREEAYFDWLDASVKIGLVQAGYAKAARVRGHSDLRLPWVAKYPHEGQQPRVERPADLDTPPIPVAPAASVDTFDDLLEVLS